MLRVRRTFDYDVISELDNAIFDPRFDEPLSETEFERTDWWLATVKDEPAGFAGARAVKGSIDLYYMVRAGVLPDYRGQQIHRRMISVRLARAKRLGCTDAITYTVSGNCGSSNNLIRAGFRMYEPPFPWVGKTGVVYWTCDLSKSRRER